MEAKNLLLDVVTRWWSTFLSLRQARHLKKTVKCLLVSKIVECVELSNEEWVILHQI